MDDPIRKAEVAERYAKKLRDIATMAQVEELGDFVERLQLTAEWIAENRAMVPEGSQFSEVSRSLKQAHYHMAISVNAMKRLRQAVGAEEYQGLHEELMQIIKQDNY